jgi:serine/threonine protein kinase/alpha-tubulin suppressor-like RCC1 family protein
MADTVLSGLPELEAEYELLAELGRGGMAVVYLARDRQLGREVAIKVIHTGAVDDASIDLQLREARTVAQLQHPNVVAIYAVKQLGTRGERGVALVMQYIPGRGLGRAMHEDGKFTAERTEAILADIAAALAYAHARGVIHRDIKPENIFLNDETGSALLSDFGIAISAESRHQEPSPDLLVGTPAYMSPEQIDDVPLDGRSDLFSLGLVGYEMLAGVRSWVDEDPSEVLFRQRFDPLPPLVDVRSDVSDRLRAVIERAVAKERTDRWPSAVAMLSALTDDEWVPDFTPRGAAPAAPGSAPPDPATSAASESAAPLSAANPTPVHTVVYRRGGTPASVAQIRPGPGRPPPPPRPAAASAGRGIVDDDLLPPLWGRSGDERKPWRIVIPIVVVCGAIAAVTLARPDTFTHLFASAGAQSDSARRDSIARASAVHAASDSATLAAARMRAAESTAAADSARAQERLAAIRDSLVRADSIARARAVATRTTPPAPPPALKADALPATTLTIATNASPVPAPTPRSVLIDPPPAPSIVAGGTHTCALTAAGAVVCWGGNDRGQLGSGGDAHAAAPTPVAGIATFTQVSAGLTHSCGITLGGGIQCWGANDFGQLGDSTAVDHATPQRVARTTGHTFRVVAVGMAHTCALTVSGEVYCWGRNNYGQLGIGSVSNERTPVRVASGMAFVELAVGWNHSCALTATGHAYCWGENANGELGDGTTILRPTPVAVVGDQGADAPAFRAIAAGGSHTCALSIGGEAYCWGHDNYGQLGTGDRIDRATPTRIQANQTFFTITTGGVHTCALTAGGAAYCWGRNSYGQLGDGTMTDRLVPVAVHGSRLYQSIDATGSHTCARGGGATMFCWGYNSDGQLGDGTITPRAEPTAITGVQ